MGIIILKKHLFLYSLFIVLSGAAFGRTLSTLCFIASGLCITVLVCNRKNMQVFLYSLIAIGACFVISGTTVSVCFTLGGILPGVFLGRGYIKKLSLPYLAVMPSVSFISLWAYLFYSYKTVNGTNIFSDVSKVIADRATTEMQNILNSGTTPLTEEMVSELTGAISSVMELMNNLIPAFLIIFSAFFSLILILLSKKFVGYLSRKVTTFSRFRVPGSLVFVSLICMVAYSFTESPAKYIFLNVLLILTSYCFLCGISLLDFALKKKVSSPLLRVIICFLILFIGNIILSGTINMLLIIMGISDSMFNYRKLSGPGKQN